MKKIITMVLAILLVVSLFGCVKTAEIKETDLIKELQDCMVGNKIFMGQYEQNNNKKDGLEPIEWIVIAKEEGKVLLLSTYVLDWKPFKQSEDDADCSWQNSVVRKFLNETFYETAFSSFIKSKIILSTITNPIYSDPENNLTGDSKTTTDKVFILSESELHEYNLFNRSSGDSYPTEYARGLGADGSYWLRDIGWYSYGIGWFETRYASEGPYSSLYYERQWEYRGVRPLVWVDIQ